jgi:acetylornithine/N-succinyldiaminopimelate aminotransferase
MNISDRENKIFFRTYKRLPLEVEYGEGAYLFTKGGDKYLDLFGGLAVNILGYNHSAVVKAVTEQIQKYSHLSNLFIQEPQINFAERLLKLSGFDRIFLTSTGTEAIEGAIKLVRKFSRGKNKTELISFSGGFHGRTYGSLSLTFKEKYRKDHEPFIPDVKNLRFNSTEDLEKNISDKTAAVFLEFIQGEGGVVPAEKDFIKKLNELKGKFNFLIVADCIQCCAGRTGKFISIHHYDADLHRQTGVDICVMAKGIGGGLPLGAILGREFLNECWSYGEHGTTFGGNPVACAAGLAVFNELESGVMENALSMGDLLLNELQELKNHYPDAIEEVRGKGLMIGVQVKKEIAQKVIDGLFDKKILVNLTNENVIRLLPPLIINEEECREFVSALNEILEEIQNE